ncbi:hypothetical protein TESG_07796 [Trichophyton tonsurans CBS 112818]|uniref:Uncharacterized protein n=2 Tax=Trichophyton TaxID=5550 RepID=F2Q1S2_TRIEC|nr:hypothetical protein TESG_07796 [Trichophyton tonsurans CBS 112818]EGE08090.1 hypothetical protein TEQG_07065 [Trichophyton equinum CBS 127.97]
MWCGISPDSTTIRADPSEDVTVDSRLIEVLGQRFILGDGYSDRVTAYTYYVPSVNAFMTFRDKTFLTGSSLDKLFLDSSFASLILHETSHARVIHPGTGGGLDGTAKEP